VHIDSYEQFYAHYHPYVAAFVARRVSVEDAADLVAEVFSIAWRRRDAVPDDALPWLYTTARNVVGDKYRSTKRLQALRQKLIDAPVEATTDPADVAADRDRLFRAFAGLADDDRELLLLVAWEGLSSDDIARVLGISSGAAAVRRHRARTRFEEAMAEAGRGADHTAANAAPCEATIRAESGVDISIEKLRSERP